MKKHSLLIILLISVYSYSQVVYEPLHRDIYNYLSRLSQKGIIDLDDLIKPLPRKYIAEKLNQLKSDETKLTNLEKEELDFFSEAFFMEMKELGKDTTIEKRLSYFSNDIGGKFRFFSYSDNVFKVNLNPILGYETSFKDGDRGNHSWNGLNLFGYLDDRLGFSFDFRSNNENGPGADYKKIFTPVTGIISINKKNSFNYAQVKTMLAYNWSWGTLSAGKDFIEYGYGQSGKIVLSRKAPPFPFVRLTVNPVDWFIFNYFHAWLSSDVVDSVNLSEYRRNIYRNKYFAWHSIIITPLNGLDISLGESVVYSDQIEAIYLMPMMFFYLADDFISNRINKPGDANSQLFASVSSKNHIKNTHLYGTLFIDELTIPGVSGSGTIFEGNENSDNRNLRTQLSYTLGASVTDIPIDNITISSEYTRINPFVYGHHTPAQTYTSSSYLMGHWVGHNSDLIFTKINYRFLRGLQANISWQHIRKGSSDYSGQYKAPQPEFLFGLKNYYTYYGIEIKYELIHDLNFQFRYLLTKIKQEMDNGIFNEYDVNEFNLALYFDL